MKHFVVFSLIMLGLCGLCHAAPKDVIRTREFFTFPYQKGVSSSPSLRIVGGDEATPHQFPYQVGLIITKQRERIFCGAALISNQYALTTAHCVSEAVYIDAVYGAHNISDLEESTRKVYMTSHYLLHPHWNVYNLTNDIAIVNTWGTIPFGDAIQPIKLPVGDDTYAGEQGTTMGWGKTQDDQQPDQEEGTGILRYESNTILSNDECKAVGHEYDSVIQDVHMCLSGDGNKGICQGDSGGPLVVDGILVGITSFSYKSCEAGKPSVFVRVTKFLDWIKANTDVNI